MSKYYVLLDIPVSLGLFIILFLMISIILFIFSPTYHRSPTISFNYYLSMIALTIFISIFQKQETLSIDDIPRYLNAFVVIIFITSIHFIVASRNSTHKKNKKTNRLIVTIKNSVFVFSISAILLLIYTQISYSLSGSAGNGGGSSGFDLAICAAIIAAFATIYNVQRVSKQELTKNRQDWITTVRLETANIISTFDMFKYALLNRAKQDKCISNCKSLLESCTKLRMFLNPGDTIAPMITAQLDAIINYCNSWLKKPTTIRSWLKGPTQSINIDKVNLHESLMPWVLVLLKAEWERVKDVLESREVMSDGFYSESVYKDEWGKKRLEKYGITVEDPQKDIKDIMEDLFPGFEFYGKDKEDIKEKLEEMGLVDE